MLIAFNKPYGVLSQFTPEPGSKWRTLAEFGLPKNVYALGRLDADSEGLLLFTDERGLNSRLLDPKHAHQREYWAQVENIPDAQALGKLAAGGIDLGDFRTQPCNIRRFDSPPLIPPRDPPIRVRKNIPDTWIALELVEGKNRQVRRMTASVGHPTLRLIRTRMGQFTLDGLPVGKWRKLGDEDRRRVFA